MPPQLFCFCVVPYLPYSDLDPATRRWNQQSRLGQLANAAADAVCAFAQPINDFFYRAYSGLGIPGAVASFLSGSSVTNFLCNRPSDLSPIPIAPGIPRGGTNCATQGECIWQVNDAPDGTPPLWITGSRSWTCADGVGTPISGFEWTRLSDSIWGYVVEFNRADGSGTIRIDFGSTSNGDRQDRVQIVSFNWSYCPGCNLPAPIPVPPDRPGRSDDPPTPPTPPQIPINVEFPTNIGLPPLVFPVIYSPILISPRIPISLSPTLNLAPRVDLNPEFAFAPTFEFNFGGISVGGGGYSEPVPDLEQLLDCDCPDPCLPASEIDYDRIKQDGYDNLRILRDLPDRYSEISFGNPVSGTSVSITLPPGAIGVLYDLDLSSYTGDTVIGGGPDFDNYYAGWFWFGQPGNPGGDRQYFTAKKGFLPCPPFCRRFTCSTTKGASVTIRSVKVER